MPQPTPFAHLLPWIWVTPCAWRWLHTHADRSYGIVQVNAIHLMRSEVRPGGPLYTTLTTANLEPANSRFSRG